MHNVFGAAVDLIPPPRWYHRLAWRLRTLRPRTSRIVLWGHHRGDRSPAPPYRIDPDSPLTRVDGFLDWLRSFDLDPNEIFAIDVGQIGMVVYRWAFDETGKLLTEVRDGERWPLEREPLPVTFGTKGPPPSILDPIRKSANRVLRAFGVKEMAA